MDEKPKVFMICGISGSGKTFFAKKLELFGVARISMDEELWPDYYIYGELLSNDHRDFLYKQALERVLSKVKNFCLEGHSCAVDMPFCKRAQRDMFRAHIESCGGESVLVWINTDISVLKSRLSDRKGKNGPNELSVSENELMRYWNGFERPLSEEHIEINGEKPFNVEELLKQ